MNVVYSDGHGRWVPRDEMIRWYNWYRAWPMPEDGQ